MEQPDSKIRQILSSAHDAFIKHDYIQAKKLLQETKLTHLSIELNNLLCEYKQQHTKAASVMRKMMDILVTVNVNLYKQRPLKDKKRTPKISHEFYFWNIMVLSQLLPNSEVTELIANEALHFVDGLRTETSLMILYQMLKKMQSSGRLASCISLIEKQNRLMDKTKKLTAQEQSYRFINQILFCKVLLKLGMIDQGIKTYMMKFKQNLDQPAEGELTQIGNIHISVYQELLRAEIQYHSKNYQHALKILSDLMFKVDKNKNKEYIKNIIDHNVAVIISNYQQNAPARVMLTKTLGYLIKDKDGDKNNQRYGMVASCRDNILVMSLRSGMESYEQLYEGLKNHHNCYSYKLNYRKAQLCLNYYHELLKNPKRVLTYKDIHDFYDTVYYYPNMPYYQQKGKNKNPNYTNNKFYYRRYVLTECQHGMKKGEVKEEKVENVGAQQSNGSKELSENKKEPSREKRPGTSKTKKKGKKEEESKEDPTKEEIFAVVEPQNKLKQILKMCEWYLKQALVVLEKEKSIIVNLEDEQKGLTEQANQKLYSEYISFKSSIYSLLCYVYLCKQQWQQTIYYANLYQSSEKQYKLQPKTSDKTYYNILTYKLEAYTQLNRLDKAYDLLHELLGSIDYSDTTLHEFCSASVHESGETYFEKMNQYSNFSFNLSVLHSKDNKIPEAYNSIQKLLQQMREIPTNPKANLPLSLIELLIHYNIRTSNQPSALQLIKRRRILNLPGVVGHYHPTLNITK